MSDSASTYSRKNPFPARISKVRNLNANGSDKETLHFEFSLANSGLHYEAGDSLGVFPENNPADVDEILSVTHLDGNTLVEGANNQPIPLREALLRQVTLREPSRQLITAIFEKCPEASDLEEFVDPEAKAALDDWINGREVIDILQAYPCTKFAPDEFLKLLRKLQPRLYSIASSPKAHPEEIHLTIAIVRYELLGRKRHGVCTSYLADRAGEGPVHVFIHTAKHFRPPEDPSRPLIMVGPGTGIAPFRAFLQEREAAGATGKNWLFFGDRHRAYDFLYEDEIAQWQASGLLHRFDSAFSRDQAKKIYVQDRMLENAAEIWKWLEEGGYFYVCGDASRMAKDVDLALHQIATTAGGKSPEEAAAYVADLKKAKRYRKDVY